LSDAQVVQTSIKILAIRASTPSELHEHVAEKFGVYVPIADVWTLLGFQSLGAAKRAAMHGRLGVATVVLPGRKNRVIKSCDFAQWLFDAERPTGFETGRTSPDIFCGGRVK
jgi:hypothetical protein